ncbi:hypothetical protein CP532_2772 [Ophiocordyceps camponoti-leonardi (nom. inval.)]|nr:hypothetical protein CP532_2772 [Ophiocordyceps camponoti-leonardi (nom. inval.)]
MAGKKGENSKKAAGNARKAEAAAQKAAVEDSRLEAAEADKWSKGAKNNAKSKLMPSFHCTCKFIRETEAAKKAEQARKKAEKDALLREEEANIGGRDEPKKSKAPVKKSRGLDLSQLDDGPAATLNASGIDNALDALSLTAGPDGGGGAIDKHPEKRFAAAYAKYEDRRLQEMKADGSGVGLRLEQRKQRIRKEFDKSPENPFNQVTAAYNATRADVSDIRAQEAAKVEKPPKQAMAFPKTLSPDALPSLRRQQLFSEFAGLKQACPDGVFVSLTPGDPTLWTAVLFVRDGPYAQAILRFQISFPDAFPSLPPLVTFSTDMFHPLISPLSTYMYTTDFQVNGTVSARDEERLPPGGFSLRHGFPHWFGRGRRVPSGSRKVSGESCSTQNSRAPSTAGSPESTARKATKPTNQQVSIYQILKYIRSSFDDEEVLDSVPLEAAGNPGAWHAWRTHRRQSGRLSETKETESEMGEDGKKSSQGSVQAPEWNWDGVWEDRVGKGIAASLSDSVLYGGGGPEELIRFLSMEDSEIASIKENIHRSFHKTA